METNNNEMRLEATRQKSYYGKAGVITEGNVRKLRSYETIVCEYNTETGEFVRLWGGYSRTTANHVNDFRRLFGLPALSKREWEALPCANEERYKVEFSNGFVNWIAGATFDSMEAAWEFAEKVMEERNYCACADVVEC